MNLNFLLSAACREGMFGRNCQQSCGSDLSCKGLRFCLPDPYGCSCASGWFGRRCETRTCEKYPPPFSVFVTSHIIDFSSFCQPVLMTRTDQTASWAVNVRMGEFASVSLDAHVPQGGEDKAVRNRVGLRLMPYFQRLYIMILPKLSPNLHLLLDWAPQILELEGNLEWNRNSSPEIYCSATGNPLPSHNSIELRKLDSTVLEVENSDKI